MPSTAGPSETTTPLVRRILARGVVLAATAALTASSLLSAAPAFAAPVVPSTPPVAAGSATAAPLTGVSGLALDASGNLYLADAANSVVEKITQAGALSIVAGTIGQAGAPTAGPATSSRLGGEDAGGPAGVAVDASGALYIADSGNHVVEKVTAGGVLSIIAGVAGVAGPPTAGPAASSTLGTPAAVAVDSSGNLYIVDTGNQVVEKVTPGGALSIVAGIVGQRGTPTAGPATESKLYNPSGAAVDPAGNLYLADTYNAMVEKITPDGTLSVLAGTGRPGPPTVGPALSSTLGGPYGGGPYGVTVDGLGNVYAVDPVNAVVEKITPQGALSIAAGVVGDPGLPSAGPASGSRLYGVAAAAADASGNLYVADSGNGVIEKISPAGSLSFFAGSLPTVPDAPTAVAAVAHYASATVSWSAPASDGDSAITGYTITASPGGATTTARAIDTSAIVSGLANGTAYTFTVTAENRIGASLASTASPAVTPVAAGVVALSVAPGNASVSVSWLRPSSNDAPGLSSFEVTASPGGRTVTTSSTSATVTGLSNGTTYTVTVTAIYLDGTRVVSAPSRAVTPVAPGSGSSPPALTSSKPTIAGTAKVGMVLTATTAGWSAGTAFHYQWYAAGASISGATKRTLTLTAQLKGKRITVAVTGAAAGYSPRSGIRVVSASTVPVAAGTLKHAVPKITGTAKVGKKLTAVAGAWTKGTRFSYAWYAAGKKIAGQTHATLILKKAQQGKAITVKVTGTLAGYTTVTQSSKATKKTAK